MDSNFFVWALQGKSRCLGLGCGGLRRAHAAFGRSFIQDLKGLASVAWDLA